MPAVGLVALPHAALTGMLIKSFYEVYNELGSGFLEAVYARAFAIALSQAPITFQREAPLIVRFRGVPVGLCKPDFVVERAVVVECKATTRHEPLHEAQLLHYLHATELELGLLLNFGPRPTFQRFISSRQRPGAAP